MATKEAIKKEAKEQKAKEMKLRKKVSMMTRTPGVSAREAIKQEAKSAGKAQKTRIGRRKLLGIKALDRLFGRRPEQVAEKTKKAAAKAMGTSTKGMGKYKEKDFYKTPVKSKGGMVKSYAAGGSVSRGQYPAQARKVKFKGVF